MWTAIFHFMIINRDVRGSSVVVQELELEIERGLYCRL